MQIGRVTGDMGDWKQGGTSSDSRTLTLDISSRARPSRGLVVDLISS